MHLFYNVLLPLLNPLQSATNATKDLEEVDVLVTLPVLDEEVLVVDEVVRLLLVADEVVLLVVLLVDVTVEVALLLDVVVLLASILYRNQSLPP